MADDDPWCHERHYKTDEQMIYCMQMPLDFTAQIPVFMWKDWHPITGGSYFGAIVFSMALAVMIELVPFIRWYLKDVRGALSNEQSDHSENPINKSETERPYKLQVRMKRTEILPHIGDTFLQLIAKSCTYLLMLVVMSYNFGIIVLTCVAFATSNFIFSIIRDKHYINSKMKAHNY